MSLTDIYNQQKFKQAILFATLRDDPTDKRTGTDIDFEYEDGKIWIKAEVKEYGKYMPKGQTILFERFCDNMANYETYGFLLWHKTPADQDIQLKDTIVVKVYHKGSWRDVRTDIKEVTFKEVFNGIAK